MTAPTPNAEPEVRVGQVWADNDKRSGGRHVKVLTVDSRHADVIACNAEGGQAGGRARRSRILIERMRPTSTGYRLVKDGPRPDGGEGGSLTGGAS